MSLLKNNIDIAMYKGDDLEDDPNDSYADVTNPSTTQWSESQSNTFKLIQEEIQRMFNAKNSRKQNIDTSEIPGSISNTA